MILVDTSAWIEFLRATGSPAHLRVRAALESGLELASTDAVLMELLAGARDEGDRERLRRPSSTGCAAVAGRRRASSATA
jgi:predicted nucleic acid-binding protein